MNWKIKAFVQSVLSRTPMGERINFLLQKHVTKSWPLGPEKFAQSVAESAVHVENFQRHGSCPLGEATFYEFGAGWNLLGPLTFYTCGVNRQILVDIRRLLKPVLVNQTIEQLGSLHSDLQGRTIQRTVSNEMSRCIDELEHEFGISYRAPMNAQRTDIPDNSIDCITSHNTLEHIPASDIVSILKECRRILHDEGVLSFRIDYQDHYSYFDDSISAYNFLQYSDSDWTRFSPGLHFQNRLRHTDYVSLLESAGFQVTEQRPVNPSPEDCETIRKLRLASRFQGADVEELGIRYSDLVACKSTKAGSLSRAA